MSPRHRTHKAKLEEAHEQERYPGNYLSGLTRGPYLGYPWNRKEGSADRVTIGTTIIDSRSVDGIKYKIRKQYPQNRIINIKLTNTSNENVEYLPSQTSNMTRDMVERFKYYDEANPKVLVLVQRNESENNGIEKHGMTYPIPSSVKGYTITPVKYLKLKTREKNVPVPEDSQYDNEVVSVPSTYKNSDDKTTDNKKMLSISGLDLMAILSQLRAENRNYSMQILV